MVAGKVQEEPGTSGLQNEEEKDETKKSTGMPFQNLQLQLQQLQLQIQQPPPEMLASEQPATQT